ncbi:prenyltransferase/squalene oxidase repeat-containing protein [Nonomuraea sp. NPDC001831]|uniref:prenyltransferase/squalene oxidase repeat-containing protein n=1 Tax=Nonomuraea sp. NPDC001831 TaxID=3364340 RepID=UPI0036C10C41
MTPTSIAAGAAADITARAGELISSLMLRPWGQVSTSVYETGRLVSLAPWLIGHRERLDHLLTAQHQDGSWGAPDGYGLVPTLSATEALLAAARRGDPDVDHDAAALAAGRGRDALSILLSGSSSGALSLPDMPAIEHIVPSLVSLINGYDGHPPLPLPAGMGYRSLDAVRSLVASGQDVPDKLLHALEIAGEAARGAAGARPSAIGTVGASPAAAAAWLGGRVAGPVLDHLEAVVRIHGGPVPVGLPITVFERGWVLSWLVRAGVPVEVPPEMIADLRAAIGPEGTPAGPGLPADADTTSVALYALALLGSPYEPDCLWHFHDGAHFATWPGEQGVSISVNAHVLDAFGQYAARRPDAAPRYGEAIAGLSAWLRDRQDPDGFWTDRWHASPYYATVSCALALADFGGPESARAVAAAVRRVLDTQRPDGSWGRWTGTREETSYAMQTLLLTPGRAEPRRRAAVERGLAYLTRAAGERHVPLWHDKDLYVPVAVVRSAELAAAHLARSA